MSYFIILKGFMLKSLTALVSLTSLVKHQLFYGA